VFARKKSIGLPQAMELAGLPPTDADGKAPRSQPADSR